MMISGTHWLMILAVITITLFAIALLIQKRNTEKKNAPPLIQTFHQMLIDNISEYNFALNKNHITVVNNDKKIAMITLDDRQKIGQRKLGEMVIFNYHKLPKYQKVLEQLAKI